MTKPIQMPTDWDYFTDEGQRFLNSVGLYDVAIVGTGRSNGILHIRDESGPDRERTVCGQHLLAFRTTDVHSGAFIVEFGVEIWSLWIHSRTHKLCGKCVIQKKSSRSLRGALLED